MEITEIKQRLTLAQVLRHYGLKADKHNRINCPFHEDKTPSMQIYWKTNTCYCFSGNCPTHGKSLDVIDFIMHMESRKLSGCTKHEALLKATAMTDESTQPAHPTAPSHPAAQLTKTAILTKMLAYFKNAVHNSPPAKEYIQSRALDYTKLEIGYNTAQFHHGTRKEEALIKSCLQIGLLYEAGTNNRVGGQRYGAFGKYCIVFALRNKEQNITGLYFRSTLNNTSQRHFYLKDREGLYPRYPEPNTKKLILTESIIDAATLLQQEEITKHYTILALYGTNGLLEEHTAAIRELKQLDEIIFFLNADEAGRTAVKKHSETLKKLLPAVAISNAEPPEGEDVNSLLQACLQKSEGRRQGHSPKPDSYRVFPDLLENRVILFSTEKENPIPATSANMNPPAPSFAQNGGNTKRVFSTSNPEAIIYETGQLHITLLGGISLSGLDRLRVTIKMTLNPSLSYHHSIRHNVDLYQDDAVEKFTRRAAEKLEIGTTIISTAIADLTEQLERYRLAQMEKKKMQQPKRRELTAEEIQAAKSYLSKRDLMQRTMDGLGETGIVGEEYNRLLMYLIFTSRKRENPLHIVSLGSSGIGKTHLQEKVSECIPEEDKKEITILSENAFYYFGQRELSHKLILIEDLDGAEAVLYPLRELETKRKITKTVPLKDSKGNLKTITLQVEGPVCVAGCTTKERLYEDNATRSFLIYIDESKEQDARIMEYQRRQSAGETDMRTEQQQKEFFQNMQRALRPVKVRNPYAPFLQIPEIIFKPRRSNAHYLQCIEVITYYHQYQRELKTESATGEKYIETTLEDIYWANKLLSEILLRKSDELSGACRNFFEKLKAHLREKGQESFYAKDIRSVLRLNPSNLKRYLIELQRHGYIKISGGSKRMGYEHKVSDYNDYENLKTGISTVLDEIYNKLQEKEKSKKHTPGDLSVAELKEAEKNGSMVQNGSVSEMDHSSSTVSMS